MAGITTAMSTSFKSEILVGTHNFTLSTGNVFKIALFKTVVGRTYDATTNNFSQMTAVTTDETSGSGYTTAGITLTNVTPTTSGTTAFTSFNTPVSWTTATFQSDGAMIYNSSASGKCVSVHSFGGPQSVSAGTFTVNMPTADASNAIIRIA